MTSAAAARTMRTVNPRLVASVFALLIIFQMTAEPVSMAFAAIASDTGCVHASTVHPGHQDDGCSDDLQAIGGAGSSPHHSDSERHCHCVHSVPQALASSSLTMVLGLPAETEMVATVLNGPAYSSPWFEFLRPPN